MSDLIVGAAALYLSWRLARYGTATLIAPLVGRLLYGCEECNQGARPHPVTGVMIDRDFIVQSVPTTIKTKPYASDGISNRNGETSSESSDDEEPQTIVVDQIDLDKAINQAEKLREKNHRRMISAFTKDLKKSGYVPSNIHIVDL